MAEPSKQNHSAHDKMHEEDDIDEKFRDGREKETNDACKMKPNGETSGRDAYERAKCEEEKRKAS